MLPGLFAPIGMISPTLLRRSRARLDGQQYYRGGTPDKQRPLLFRFFDLLNNIPLMSSAPPKPKPQPDPEPQPDPPNPPPRPPPSGPRPFPGDEDTRPA